MNRFDSWCRATLALAFAAAISSLALPSTAAANLFTNPGFESGGGSYSGWTTFGGGVQLSLPAGDNIIRSGQAASKTFGEFTGCPGSGYKVGGFFQTFTPIVGKLYTLDGYSYISSADPLPGTDTCNRNRMIAKIVFFDAAVAGNEISSNEVVIGDGNSVTNRWNPFTVSAPAPTGALRVEALFLFLQPACDAGAVFVDDVAFDASTPSMLPNLLANPSFSTGLTGWTTFGNVFPDSRSFIVHTPAGAAKMFGPFGAPGDASGMYQSFPAASGSSWDLRVHSLDTCRDDPVNGTNDNFAVAKIAFLNASLVEIGSAEKVIASNASSLGKWTENWVAATAPIGTTSVRAYLLFVQPTPTQGGSFWVDDVSLFRADATSVPGSAQRSFDLLQNAPNPFSAGTRIDFILGRGGPVEIAVLDVAGRQVAKLFRGALDPGAHSVRWNGRSTAGSPMPAGIYRYVMTGPDGRLARTMVLGR